MLPIPDEILKYYNEFLEKKALPQERRSDCRKWLCYFLEFRSKYHPPDSRSEQVRLYIEKLRSKGQSDRQLNEAAQASLLFYSSQPKATPASIMRGSGDTPGTMRCAFA